jgi:hypothetical protein
MTLFSGTFHQKPAPFSFGVASFRSETRMIRENHATFSFQPRTILRKEGTMSKKEGTMDEKDGTMDEKDETFLRKDGMTDKKRGTSPDFRLRFRAARFFSPNEKPVAHSNVVELAFLAQRITSLF